MSWSGEGEEGVRGGLHFNMCTTKGTGNRLDRGGIALNLNVLDLRRLQVGAEGKGQRGEGKKMDWIYSSGQPIEIFGREGKSRVSA